MRPCRFVVVPVPPSSRCHLIPPLLLVISSPCRFVVVPIPPSSRCHLVPPPSSSSCCPPPRRCLVPPFPAHLPLVTPPSALVPPSSLFPPSSSSFCPTPRAGSTHQPPHKQLLVGLGAGGVLSCPHRVPRHRLREAGGGWCAVVMWQRWRGVVTWRRWRGVVTWRRWRGVVSCEFLVPREVQPSKRKKQISQFTKKETNEKNLPCAQTTQ
jgi:hypothetical protein